MPKSARELERDLVEHARAQLARAATRNVAGGMGPATAAAAAIRETKALFPPDWHLAVRGSDREELVEIWEVDHKYGQPLAEVWNAAADTDEAAQQVALEKIRTLVAYLRHNAKGWEEQGDKAEARRFRRRATDIEAALKARDLRRLARLTTSAPLDPSEYIRAAELEPLE